VDSFLQLARFFPFLVDESYRILFIRVFQVLAIPLFPLVAASVGRLQGFEKLALSPGRRFDPGQAIHEFPPAGPVFTNTALPFTSIKIHCSFPSDLLLEEFFAHAAIGTEPGVGKVFESGARGDTTG
jgi:hypothetical protein